MIINSIENHLFTIIILHGMYQDNSSLLKLVNIIQSNNKNIKIILPNAPLRTITWPQGNEYKVRAWYNYYTRNDNKPFHDDIEKEHFLEQTERINKIIYNETRLIHEKNIIISGVSQGGTLAFNIGLHSPYKLGGLIGIHTIFMDNIILTNNVNKIPIFLFSGNNDNIYNIRLQKQSIKKLDTFKLNIEWHIEKNLNHCEYSKKESEFMVNAIKQIL